jgi:hypothetical protein
MPRIRPPEQPEEPTCALEQLLTPQQIAQAWQLDESTVRKIFCDQSGVLKIGKTGRRDGKRDYITLRVPRAVYDRVLKERSQ